MLKTISLRLNPQNLALFYNEVRWLQNRNTSGFLSQKSVRGTITIPNPLWEPARWTPSSPLWKVLSCWFSTVQLLSPIFLFVPFLPTLLASGVFCEVEVDRNWLVAGQRKQSKTAAVRSEGFRHVVAWYHVVGIPWNKFNHKALHHGLLD